MLHDVIRTEGLREQKKKRARDALEHSALKLFEQSGFDSVTIREVAESAGMSPRTFFRYFESKEDVVFARQAQDFGVLKKLLAKVPQDNQNPFETMKAALFSFAEYFQNQPPEEIKLRAQLLAESLPLRRRAAHEIQAWGDDLARDLADREGSEVHPRHFLVAGVGLQVLQVAGAAWGSGDTQGSLTDILEQMFSELKEQLVEKAES